MKTKIFSFFILAALLPVKAQIGVKTTSPSAALDMVSSGNTAATKALEINNSSATEMVTVLDDGKLGVGSTNPDANLEVVGRVEFPTVAQTSAVGPYSLLAINQATGSVGTYTPAPSATDGVFVQTTTLTTAPLNETSTTSRNIKFDIAPVLNTSNIILGEDTGISLSDGSTSATVSYFQVPQAGLYQIELSGTFKCNSFSTFFSGSLNYTVNLGLWRAPGNTSYTKIDDYRIVNLSGATLESYTYAYPFSQVYTVFLSANDKINLRVYRAASTGGAFGGCSIQLPGAGDQKNSAQLIITRLQ